MTIQTRFAPSPTGYLHVGNIRTALFNYLIAKKNGGNFILRIDDTDTERSSQVFEDAIKRDLEWLGVEWDRIEKQSLRFERYRDCLETLKKDQRLYPCYETTQILELKRKKLLNMGKPPVYDRSALTLSNDQIQKFISEGREPHWRFLLHHQKVSWDDEIAGNISVDLASVSDPVFVKEDGQFLYTIASVCDDIDFSITHVIRGSDHITNTATQIQLLETLGSIVPFYGHHSLLTGLDGDNLSKRLGSLAIHELRSSGIEPMALISMLSALGSSKPVRIIHSLDELFSDFNLGTFSSAPTKFDPELLTSISIKVLNSLPFEFIKSDLEVLRVPEEKRTLFWEAVRENIQTRREIKEVWDFCVNGAKGIVSDEDKEFVGTALKLLPALPFTQETWKNWTEEVSKNTGRKGKNLFMPLRSVVTGKSTGPDMSKLMPLLQKRPFF